MALGIVLVVIGIAVLALGALVLRVEGGWFISSLLLGIVLLVVGTVVIVVGALCMSGVIATPSS